RAPAVCRASEAHNAGDSAIPAAFGGSDEDVDEGRRLVAGDAPPHDRPHPHRPGEVAPLHRLRRYARQLTLLADAGILERSDGLLSRARVETLLREQHDQRNSAGQQLRTAGFSAAQIRKLSKVAKRSGYESLMP